MTMTTMKTKRVLSDLAKHELSEADVRREFEEWLTHREQILGALDDDVESYVFVATVRRIKRKELFAADSHVHVDFEKYERQQAARGAARGASR